MNQVQLLSIAVIVLLVAGFLWGRAKYDVVAGCALALAVLVGVVAPKDAFRGFSDDIVIIVASAFVLSKAITHSGVLSPVLTLLGDRLKTVNGVLIALVVFVGLLSAVIKNVAALAMTIPIAFAIAKRLNVSPSVFLMPMSFASLLGGMLTLIGTSPNIVVSRVRQELTGKAFGMLDFLPVGLCIALAGVVFLALGYRLLPKNRRGPPAMDDAVHLPNYLTEVQIPAESPAVGKTIADLTRSNANEVQVKELIRDKQRSLLPLPDVALVANDILILKGDKVGLDGLIKTNALQHDSHERPIIKVDPMDELAAVEGVIRSDSRLIGLTAGTATLHRDENINLLAISRQDAPEKGRIRDIPLRAGDVVILSGSQIEMPQRLSELGILPLAAGPTKLGQSRNGALAIFILFVCVLAVSLGLTSAAIGFAGAALAVVVTGVLPWRDAYDGIEWPVLVLLAAVIPVSDALEKHGVTDIMASQLSTWSAVLPPWGAVAMMLIVAMAVTPFLNNAATVLIMAPIAISFSKNLGFRPEPFLMAVAVGAACDFLTPIGHQCNTLVMGPGGYRFSDYARLGAPLSLIVISVGVPAILLFWPVR